MRKKKVRKQNVRDKKRRITVRRTRDGSISCPEDRSEEDREEYKRKSVEVWHSEGALSIDNYAMYMLKEKVLSMYLDNH